MRLFALSAMMLVTASVEAATPHVWAVYHNARFGTAADYPSDIFRRPKGADNGDGQSWTSTSGAQLRIFGSWNSLDQSPADYDKFLTRSDPGRQVTYRVVKPGFLVRSGQSKGRIFYERYQFDAASGAIHALVLDYPAASRSEIDPLIGRMSKSLHGTAPQ